MPPLLIPPPGRQWLTVGEALKEAGVQPGQKVRLGGMMTREEWEEKERIRNARFVLVRNGTGKSDLNEAMPCDKCGAGRYPTPAHPYLTLMCVEQPFRGVEEAMYALGVARHDSVLQEAVLDYWDEIGDSHPFSAPLWRPTYRAERILAFAIGTVEEIDEARAYKLAREIQGKRPPKPFIL